MASLDPIQPVTPGLLSSALPPVRVDPERDRKGHARDEREELLDKLELHEEESETPIEPPPPPVLFDYEGLDLTA